MIKPTPGSILSLQCGDAIAAALGCVPVPVVRGKVDREVMAGVDAGATIAVLTWSGEALIWPLAAAIQHGGRHR